MDTSTLDTQTITAPAVSASLSRAVTMIDHERCDLCGHRAYVVTAVETAAGTMPLAFCKHDYEQVGVNSGPIVADLRNTLS